MASKSKVIPWSAALTVILAQAGTCGVCSKIDSERHEFRVLAGYSPATSTLIGTTTNRRFGMVEFDYSYRCRSSKNTSLSYTVGVVPVAILRQPLQTATVIASPTVSFTRQYPAHSVYGFGVMPVGFMGDFVRRSKVHPIAEANGGIIASTEPIPERGPDATGLNFLFSFGAGLRWRVKSGHAITVGYRFLHISNAYTTSFNPCIDNNVIYASYSFLH